MSRPATNLRESILEQARKLLLAEGYTRMSMRRIASRVGCTATSLYLYFKNKNGLFHALMDEGMDKLFVGVDHALDSSETTPQERLREVFRSYLEFGLENPEFYEVMFLLHPRHTRRYPPEKYRAARNRLERVGVDIALARGDDPGRAEVQVLAALAWTSLHGTISLLVAQRVDARLDQETLADRAVEHAMALALPPQS